MATAKDETSNQQNGGGANGTQQQTSAPDTTASTTVTFVDVSVLNSTTPSSSSSSTSSSTSTAASNNAYSDGRGDDDDVGKGKTVAAVSTPAQVTEMKALLEKLNKQAVDFSNRISALEKQQKTSDAVIDELKKEILQLRSQIATPSQANLPARQLPSHSTSSTAFRQPPPPRASSSSTPASPKNQSGVGVGVIVNGLGSSSPLSPPQQSSLTKKPADAKPEDEARELAKKTNNFEDKKSLVNEGLLPIAANIYKAMLDGSLPQPSKYQQALLYYYMLHTSKLYYGQCKDPEYVLLGKAKDDFVNLVKVYADHTVSSTSQPIPPPAGELQSVLNEFQTKSNGKDFARVVLDKLCGLKPAELVDNSSTFNKH
jgi:hypothetical protein